MNIKKLKIAEEIIKTAEQLMFADDYEYIYDPDHKKNPGGGYVKTESGWSKGKENKDENKQEKKDEKVTDNENNSKQKITRQNIEYKLKTFSSDKIKKMSEDKDAPSLLLDILSYNENDSIRRNVASNESTHEKTLDRLANDKNFWVRKDVAKNKNTSKKTLAKLSEDENPNVYKMVAYNKNAPSEALEYIHNKIMKNYIGDESDIYTIEAIAKNKNTKTDTLNQIAKKWKQGTEIGDAARDNLKEKGDYNPNVYGDKVENIQKSKLPKYKFKGDDKTAPIIRAKFEKDQNKEETDVIYGEMAKFSRDNVAPMGVYHGRTKEQLKADFIKNMNPSNYASPESFKNAQDRIRKMSAQDFSRILASIFAEEDEEI